MHPTCVKISQTHVRSYLLLLTFLSHRWQRLRSPKLMKSSALVLSGVFGRVFVQHLPRLFFSRFAARERKRTRTSVTSFGLVVLVGFGRGGPRSSAAAEVGGRRLRRRAAITAPPKVRRQRRSLRRSPRQRVRWPKWTVDLRRCRCHCLRRRKCGRCPPGDDVRGHRERRAPGALPAWGERSWAKYAKRVSLKARIMPRKHRKLHVLALQELWVNHRLLLKKQRKRRTLQSFDGDSPACSESAQPNSVVWSLLSTSLASFIKGISFRNDGAQQYSCCTTEDLKQRDYLQRVQELFRGSVCVRQNNQWIHTHTFSESTLPPLAPLVPLAPALDTRRR